jgi:UDP-N-acetylmuramoyl-tripeptide--D-alanyl-D-alanine ligase
MKGQLSGSGGRFPQGVSIDSRTLVSGDLFFALRGENTDGRRYLREAKAKGAIGAVVEKDSPEFTPEDFPVILTRDAAAGLQALAFAQRRRFRGYVAAVTGSTGKTTTKEILAALLEGMGPVLRTQGNLNNQLGLPLTVLSLKETHRSMVLEMGMSGLGEIDALASLTRPDSGIVTNIGCVHMEKLGSREKIAQAKCELFSYIHPEGILILNAADRRWTDPWLSRASCPAATAGEDAAGADFWVESLGRQGRNGQRYRFYQGRQLVLEGNLPMPGRHNGLNALMASLAARRAGVDWADIGGRLARVEAAKMRFEFVECPGWKVTLIHDAYNANPDSMAAALETLSETGEGRRLGAVLGGMSELGAYASQAHLEAGKLAGRLGLDFLLTVGGLAKGIAEGALREGMSESRVFTAEDNEEAFRHLQKMTRPGDWILFKGSRAAHIEDIIAAVQAAEG